MTFCQFLKTRSLRPFPVKNVMRPSVWFSSNIERQIFPCRSVHMKITWCTLGLSISITRLTSARVLCTQTYAYIYIYVCVCVCINFCAEVRDCRYTTSSNYSYTTKEYKHVTLSSPDLRFSQWCCWRFSACEVWRSVIAFLFPYVLQKRAAFALRVKRSTGLELLAQRHAVT